MFENGLHGLVVAPQQDHVLVEGFNAANQLDAVYQKDGDRGVFFSQGVKKYILKVLSFVHNELNGGIAGAQS